MTALVTDRELEARLIAERQGRGEDRYDEVWDGVYVMSPDPGNLHQSLVGDLTAVLKLVLEWNQLGQVFPGVNVTDRDEDWRANFRCPDVAVYLRENPAVDCESHWRGGPDLAIEIVSPGEQPRDKLDFYGTVNTREVLIVDREPWQLELYRLQNGQLMSQGMINESNRGDGPLLSETTGIAFALIAGADRPLLWLQHAASQQTWTF